jgi:hypothetical protein
LSCQLSAVSSQSGTPARLNGWLISAWDGGELTAES